LWFLRRNERFWNGVGIASMAFAAMGLIAVLVPLVVHTTGRSVLALLVELLALSQLLGVPLWFVAFVLFAWIAPTRAARGKMMVSLAIALVIRACALLHWLVPDPPW